MTNIKLQKKQTLTFYNPYLTTKSALRRCSVQAFTLLELLLVIAVVAVLAGIILFALNPAKRLEDANNAQTMAKSDDIRKAIEAYAIDHAGSMPTNIALLTTYGLHNICKAGQSSNCINLDQLVTDGYLGALPEDKEGSTTVLSGYTLEYNPQKGDVQVYNTATYSEIIDTQSSLTTGLVGYWKMDESSWTNNCSTGTVLDSSGNNNHGKSCPNSTGPLGGSLGIYDKAGDFDNVNDYIRVEHSESLNITSNITMSAWVTADTLQLWDSILMKTTNGAWTDGYGIYYHNVNGLCAFVTHYNSYKACTTDFVVTPTFQHVMAVYNGTTLKLYLNNVEKASTNINVSISTNTGPLGIGNGGGFGSFHWDGKLDDVRVYNRVLNTDERSALYNYVAPAVAHWKFDEGTATLASDSSGNNFNGTLTNGPTWVSGKYASAINFDGSNDNVYVTDPIGGELDFGNRSFTTMAWVKVPNGLSSYYQIIGKKASYNSSSVGWQFWLDFRVSSVLSLRVNDGSASGDITPGPPANLTSLFNGNWRHVAVVVNIGANATYYVDGVNYGTSSLSSMPGSLSNSEAIKIGGNGGDFLPGQIDDVRIYNFALTNDQVIKVMNNEI